MDTMLEDYREIETGAEGELDSTKKKEEADFKMVTFTLANRHYAIDIMKVKEISKAGRFTYVPNAPVFVEGVYNLRGEIITIISLRKMFHLPALERKNDEQASILILGVQESVIGVIVDVIENVLGVQSRDIQPRHPLFTDIQMKYISGIIEVKEKLYVILDVDRIFGEEEEPEKDAVPVVAADALPETKPEAGAKKAPRKKDDQDLDFQFVRETLQTFAHFYIDPGNELWARERLAEWKKIRMRAHKDVQLGSLEDAEGFLDSFYSPYTGMLWGEEYKDEFSEVLWKEADTVKAWNPDTGKGCEAYSLCSLLRLRYPKARLKVWACDNNLLNISAAPTLLYPRENIPDYLVQGKLAAAGKLGWQFSQEIRDLVLFEYHDIVNGTTLPELDLIVARDVLSFYSAAQKEKLVADFYEKLATGGILVVGTNERIARPGFSLLHEGNIVAYKKEKE